jgi:hypothetical protein
MYLLERFRNYCGLKNVVRSGFPWEKTTKGDVASVCTNCETAITQNCLASDINPRFRQLAGVNK